MKIFCNTSSLLNMHILHIKLIRPNKMLCPLKVSAKKLLLSPLPHLRGSHFFSAPNGELLSHPGPEISLSANTPEAGRLKTGKPEIRNLPARIASSEGKGKDPGRRLITGNRVSHRAHAIFWLQDLPKPPYSGQVPPDFRNIER